jgi:hypothetical protein
VSRRRRRDSVSGPRRCRRWGTPGDTNAGVLAAERSAGVQTYGRKGGRGFTVEAQRPVQSFFAAGFHWMNWATEME